MKPNETSKMDDYIAANVGEGASNVNVGKDISSVNLGNIEGEVQGSIIAGRDIHQNIYYRGGDKKIVDFEQIVRVYLEKICLGTPPPENSTPGQVQLWCAPFSAHSPGALEVSSLDLY